MGTSAERRVLSAEAEVERLRRALDKLWDDALAYKHFGGFEDHTVCVCRAALMGEDFERFNLGESSTQHPSLSTQHSLAVLSLGFAEGWAENDDGIPERVVNGREYERMIVMAEAE